MQLVLEKRPERSALAAVASPLVAIALSLITMAVMFAVLGKIRSRLSACTFSIH